MIDTPERVTELLRQWENGELSRASFDSYISDIFLEPFLACLESEDGEYMRFGSCCCSSHPPDRSFKVEFTIQPHGFVARRVQNER